MKSLMLLGFTLITLSSVAQVIPTREDVSSHSTIDAMVNQIKARKVIKEDTSQHILRIIADGFYSRADKTLDSSCVFALGSAKFRVYDTHRIDSVMVSLGIPSYIAEPLKEAIYASASQWKLEKGIKSIQVVVPLFIAPSMLCKEEDRQDNILGTAANMFVYQGEYNPVPLSSYWLRARGKENGLILSPLLIRGRTTDVYLRY